MEEFFFWRRKTKVPKYEILKFLAENQDFSSLYKKFNLTSEQVKDILLDCAKNFKTQKKVKVFIDGASIPNPGPAGAGVVIYEGKNKIKAISKFLGQRTNNQAEYLALLIALDEIEKIDGEKEFEILSDSQLLVSQINGKWRVKDPSI
ncbi:MAG: ribonuclease HI family protein, partial [Elusimicrobia bacterium]|nr:ribonuclease HI family protein [Elusimicrobiota bacterium]